MSSLAGKRALVLGGTSGIGLATARLLVAAGTDVIAFGRSEEKITAAVSEFAASLEPKRGKFDAKSLDVLDRPAMEAAFEANKGFDYLVCAATGGERAIGPFMEMDLDGFQRSFAKLWGYANAVRLGVGHMSERGSVVLVSGTPAQRPRPGQIALSCVGGAVENMVKALASEIAPRRINGVSPGLIDTPMFSGLGDKKDATLANLAANFAIPRPGLPEEVARGIVFALENDYMTGTIINIDGGLVVNNK